MPLAKKLNLMQGFKSAILPKVKNCHYGTFDGFVTPKPLKFSDLPPSLNSDISPLLPSEKNEHLDLKYFFV